MAKNVVLKDRDGNELNVNLYNHKITIENEDGLACVIFKILSYRNTPFTTYGELYSYLNDRNDKTHYGFFHSEVEEEITQLEQIDIQEDNILAEISYIEFAPSRVFDNITPL